MIPNFRTLREMNVNKSRKQSLTQAHTQKKKMPTYNRNYDDAKVF